MKPGGVPCLLMLVQSRHITSSCLLVQVLNDTQGVSWDCHCATLCLFLRAAKNNIKISFEATERTWVKAGTATASFRAK